MLTIGRRRVCALGDVVLDVFLTDPPTDPRTFDPGELRVADPMLVDQSADRGREARAALRAPSLTLPRNWGGNRHRIRLWSRGRSGGLPALGCARRHCLLPPGRLGAAHDRC